MFRSAETNPQFFYAGGGNGIRPRKGTHRMKGNGGGDTPLDLKARETEPSLGKKNH